MYYYLYSLPVFVTVRALLLIHCIVFLSTKSKGFIERISASVATYGYISVFVVAAVGVSDNKDAEMEDEFATWQTMDTPWQKMDAPRWKLETLWQKTDVPR